MSLLSIISIFCDDIREEKSGTEILIGIMPENLNVPKFPFSFPKLAIYTRIHLVPEFDPGPISIWLRRATGDDAKMTDIDENLVLKTREDALAKGAPLAGIISRGFMVPFPISEPGKTLVIVKTGTEEHVGAFLNAQVGT